MKAKLTYNLPEDRQYFLLAAKAESLALALWDISSYFRSTIKHGPEQDIEQMQKAFYEILEDHDINLDNLIEWTTTNTPALVVVE